MCVRAFSAPIDFATYEVKLVYLVKYDVCIEFFCHEYAARMLL